MTIQGPPGNNSNHSEPTRGNGNAPEPTRYHLQTPLPQDHLLGKLFKYLARCAHGASTPSISSCVYVSMDGVSRDWLAGKAQQTLKSLAANGPHCRDSPPDARPNMRLATNMRHQHGRQHAVHQEGNPATWWRPTIHNRFQRLGLPTNGSW